ncbi:hypothetical protein MRX96_013261 [Rhipicephalus microplus]
MKPHRRTSWPDATTRVLIRFWEDNLEALRSSMRNAHIYARILESLNAGPPHREGPKNATVSAADDRAFAHFTPMCVQLALNSVASKQRRLSSDALKLNVRPRGRFLLSKITDFQLIEAACAAENFPKASI